jgi:hypothetical protein
LHHLELVRRRLPSGLALDEFDEFPAPVRVARVIARNRLDVPSPFEPEHRWMPHAEALAPDHGPLALDVHITAIVVGHHGIDLSHGGRSRFHSSPWLIVEPSK